MNTTVTKAPDGPPSRVEVITFVQRRSHGAKQSSYRKQRLMPPQLKIFTRSSIIIHAPAIKSRLALG